MHAPITKFLRLESKFCRNERKNYKRERANCAGPEKIHDSAKLSPRMMDIFKVVGLLKAALGSL